MLRIDPSKFVVGVLLHCGTAYRNDLILLVEMEVWFRGHWVSSSLCSEKFTSWIFLTDNVIDYAISYICKTELCCASIENMRRGLKLMIPHIRHLWIQWISILDFWVFNISFGKSWEPPSWPGICSSWIDSQKFYSRKLGANMSFEFWNQNVRESIQHKVHFGQDGGLNSEEKSFKYERYTV